MRAQQDLSWEKDGCEGAVCHGHVGSSGGLGDLHWFLVSGRFVLGLEYCCREQKWTAERVLLAHLSPLVLGSGQALIPKSKLLTCPNAS